MLFFSDPTTHSVGLDLSDRVFRLIEIQHGPFYSKKPRLHRYAEERLPEGVFTRGEFTDTKAVVSHLKSLVKKAYGSRSSRGVVVSLPETRTFIKVITIKRPEKLEEMRQRVLAEAELHIPSALSELYLDWQPLEDPKTVGVDKPLMVTIGAAPKSIIDKYSSTLEAAGLVPVAFEIEAQAIVRSVLSFQEIENGGQSIGIVDFGATRSSFIVFDHNTIQFTVSIPLSGDEVTRQIAQALKVDAAEAERTKRVCGVDAHKCGTTLWKIMEPFLKEMTGRIVDAVNFYQEHFPNGRALEKVIICGGGANMNRIDELLSELTKSPVVKADPWINIEPNRCPLPREIILSSTTAVGLALRHMSEMQSLRKKKI